MSYFILIIFLFLSQCGGGGLTDACETGESASVTVIEEDCEFGISDSFVVCVDNDLNVTAKGFAESGVDLGCQFDDDGDCRFGFLTESGKEYSCNYPGSDFIICREESTTNTCTVYFE